MEFIENEVYVDRHGSLYYAKEVHTTHTVLEHLLCDDRQVVFYDNPRQMDRFNLATEASLAWDIESTQNSIAEAKQKLAEYQEAEGVLDAARLVIRHRG